MSLSKVLCEHTVSKLLMFLVLIAAILSVSGEVLVLGSM